MCEHCYLDSKASQHMSPLKHLFRDYQELDTPKTILLGDNNSHNALGFGSILLKLQNGQTLLVQNILFISSLAKNLLFVTQITNFGNTIITFTKDTCIIKTTNPNTCQSIGFQILKLSNLLSLGIGIDPSIERNVVTTSTTTSTKSDTPTCSP